MVLLGFSVECMTDPIQNGLKLQTTRPVRKYPVKVGNFLQLYFKQRMKSSCENCLKNIIGECDFEILPLRRNSRSKTITLNDKKELVTCSAHNNFFGETVCTESLFLRKETGNLLIDWDKADLEAYAIADGFPKGFRQADKWFSTTYNADWMHEPYDIIKWLEAPVNGRVVA